MSAKNILNLLLLLLAMVLAGIIYFTEDEATELEKLTAVDIDTINRIHIHHNDNHTTITRQGRHWRITQPIDIAANDFRINSLLKLLQAPVHRRYSAADISMEEAGLAMPTTSVHFNDRQISFGISNPVTGLRYIETAYTVYTIEDVYYPLISSHFSTLVSFNLLPADSKITRLVLPGQIISRNNNGLWQSSIGMSADDIVATLQHWKTDQAFGVHEYLQRENLGEILVYLTGSEQPLKFVISDTDPWLILARPDIGLEYHLEIDAYDRLVNPGTKNDSAQTAIISANP